MPITEGMISLPELTIDTIPGEVLQAIEKANGLYYRLVLIIAPAGSGKTGVLHAVQKQYGLPLVNVNMELSRLLLDLTERQRTLQMSRLLERLCAEAGHDAVLLDNVEILFDASLRQDPLHLLQGVARNRTVVAAWNGILENEQLIYASPDHPEYRRYPKRDFLAITPDEFPGGTSA